MITTAVRTRAVLIALILAVTAAPAAGQVTEGTNDSISGTGSSADGSSARGSSPRGWSTRGSSHDESLVCAAGDEARGQVWLRAVQSRRLEEDDAIPLLEGMADSLAVVAAQRPDDVALQYELALVLGARADLGEGSDQVNAAEALGRQIEVVFALDPDHAGTNFLSGRLQAAVLRMGGFKRFIATRILGGNRLGEASWEDARRLLEAAAEGDPCMPDHHYELARLYYDRDEPELAARQLERFFAVTGSRELFADVLAKGQRLEEELEEELERELP